ncbi:MAG: hypothetical protein AB1505_36580 [Candidatus Latescibacterota bacterium]
MKTWRGSLAVGLFVVGWLAPPCPAQDPGQDLEVAVDLVLNQGE